MEYFDLLVNDDATKVSRKVFTSEEIYLSEKKHIFGKSWIYLGHESQIPNPGDYILSYIAETSVIVSRDKNQSIHVSINSCSHRGLPVARVDKGNVKRFICPYHNWSFDLEGNLSAIPQERGVANKLCKAELGLKKIPRVEKFCGMIFGCLDPEVESLDSYLGDMRFYLECIFDRCTGGSQVLGVPAKWLINTNWKLPVENQLGDVAHGPFLHGAFLKGSPQAAELEAQGFNVVPKPGHGLSVRLMEEGTPVEKCMAGSDGFTLFDKEVSAYMKEQHQEVERRLGKVRARLRPLCYSVYPNLSLLWTNNTIRQSHPRGPGKTEYWSWWVVDKDIPDHIKQKLQGNYTFFFGPGGALEQEDSEAWSQQFIGASSDYMEDRSLCYAMGLGEESDHPELPGRVGNVFNEFYARGFYLRWKQELKEGSAESASREKIALSNLA